jgi:hypothetical protein
MARKRNEARSVISAEGAAAPLTHRRSLRAPVAPAPVETEEVSAVDVPEVSEQEEVAKLAYSYWEARGGQNGSPEDDWHRAVQEVRQRRSLLTR